MKYVVIGPTWPFRGGIAHYTTLLVKHMREAGHETRFITYLKQYPKWLYPGNTAMDPSPESSVLKVDCDRVLIPWDPFSWWKTLQMIKREQPDALILQWWTPFWSPFLFFLTRMLHRYHQPKIKVIVLYHHVIAPDGGIFDWFLARRIWRHADAHVVMSEEDFALLRRALPKAKIQGTTLPPYDVFSREPLPKQEALLQLGIRPTAPVLLFFGFVRRYKGLRYLIDALAVARKKIAVELLIVGEFWEDAQPYYERVANLGLNQAVHFYPGYVPNEKLTVYFSACDVVVMPYLEATQSGVAQVALGFERPMIATRVGGLPEVVIDGENGLIAQPADVESLAVAIVQMFEQDCVNTMSENIRQQKQHASWLPMVQLLDQITVAQITNATPS